MGFGAVGNEGGRRAGHVVRALHGQPLFEHDVDTSKMQTRRYASLFKKCNWMANTASRKQSRVS